MKFFVRDRYFKRSNDITNVFYLIEDNWDDWGKYSTMYDLVYISPENEEKYIGKVKIGEKNMGSTQRRPNIPLDFEELNKNFFSLGQSDYYYENLNKLKDKDELRVLKRLNDIAFDLQLFDDVSKYQVTSDSLMRSVNDTTIRNQFYRVAHGGARLSKYSFNFELEALKLEFEVLPDLQLPTNVHAIIGRNGVGKTRLLKEMIKSIIGSEGTAKGKFEFTAPVFQSFGLENPPLDKDNPFANVIYVAFSAFDDFHSLKTEEGSGESKVSFVKLGLPTTMSPLDDIVNSISNNFARSLRECFRRDRKRLLKLVLEILERDIIFREADILSLEREVDQDDFERIASIAFNKLSSGHKIILLTFTKLIGTLVEKSLVLIDEPEVHLHPPLISSFIRGLSELLRDRNAVAIIATHSPVVLQEVPKRCAWKLRRCGDAFVSAERLRIECFGENIGVLTRDVFGYELTNSGFHKLLQDAAEKHRDYEHIIKLFNNELGAEAKGILRAILYDIERQEEQS
ncbi:AAA family ATPase [Abiotrophia sp. HMSC24B09]|uniref:AAA family ATPase n=1 Tax=Abiotrophia sp. HMSC24B09 TaxID=1581061 RepID=UPI0025BA6428|nr:AAA family ATPase [Abiotrophia sp. HMSC24B09]